jgi:hypothetical protein
MCACFPLLRDEFCSFFKVDFKVDLDAAKLLANEMWPISTFISQKSSKNHQKICKKSAKNQDFHDKIKCNF